MLVDGGVVEQQHYSTLAATRDRLEVLDHRDAEVLEYASVDAPFNQLGGDDLSKSDGGEKGEGVVGFSSEGPLFDKPSDKQTSFAQLLFVLGTNLLDFLALVIF